MRLIITLLVVGLLGCASAPNPKVGHIEVQSYHDLAYVCSNNARLANHVVCQVTSMTTVAELVSWIKIEQHAWSEMASDLDK